MPDPDLTIVDRPDAHRYEAFLAEQPVGFVEYRLAGSRRILLHTEVDPGFEGRGIAGAMARHALDAARAGGFRVTAKCPFIRGWLARHPEYDDIVTRLAEDRPAG
jgi:predicted GNAT family acetyltransferase